MRTLNGFLPHEIMQELDRQLPPSAYKAITGGPLKGMTDIKPAFSYKEMDRIFGPAGFGWGYTYDSEGLRYIPEDKFTIVPSVSIWYNLYVRDEAGDLVAVRSEPVPMPGYNTNNGSSENSIKGAITTGIGSAIHTLGYQISVYLGLRSHDKVYDQALAMYTDDTINVLALLREYTDGPMAGGEELLKATSAMKDGMKTEPDTSIRLMQLVSGTRFRNVPKTLAYKMVDVMNPEHPYHVEIKDAFQEVVDWW